MSIEQSKPLALPPAPSVESEDESGNSTPRAKKPLALPEPANQTIAVTTDQALYNIEPSSTQPKAQIVTSSHVEVPAAPPTATSRDQYLPPEEEPDEPEPQAKPSRPAITVEFTDSSIRKVLDAEAASLVNFLKKRLADMKGEDHRAKKTVIASKYKLDLVRKLASKVRESEAVSELDVRTADIDRFILEKKEDFFDVIFNAAVNRLTEEQASRASAFQLNDRNRRAAVTKMLPLINNNATYYDILEIPSTASDDQIKTALKKMTMLVHTDKNEDKMAKLCMQKVNDAKSTLTDPRKKAEYDRQLKDPSQQSKIPTATVDLNEEFDDSAFGRNGDDYPSSDEDFDDDEDDIPKKDEDIAKIHSKYVKGVLAYLMNGADSKIDIKKMNNKIKKVNEKKGRKGDLYQMSEGIATSMRDDLNSLQAKMKPVDAKVKAETVKTTFRRQCLNEYNQWPKAWADAFGKVADQRLVALTTYNPNEPKNDASKREGKQGNRNSSRVNQDVNMEDAPGGSASNTGHNAGMGQSMDVDEEHVSPNRPNEDSDYNAGQDGMDQDNMKQEIPPPRETQLQQKSPVGWRFVVEVPEANPVKLVPGSELGYEATRLYHELPEEQKNIINGMEEVYKDVRLNLFVGIRGVAFYRLGTSGICYVWVDRQDDPNPQKAHILSRTALRAWIGHKLADKKIDDFLVKGGQIAVTLQELVKISIEARKQTGGHSLQTLVLLAVPASAIDIDNVPPLTTIPQLLQSSLFFTVPQVFSEWHHPIMT
ncbi:DnaJ-like protein [Colletotrichum sp. SAR 10_99]|nr:DnaJ-like protein [Colletotrichum sp. SAR 10_99]